MRYLNFWNYNIVKSIILDEIRRIVGLGTFGKVLECIDSKYGDKVAVKVVRQIPRYVSSAIIEADVLLNVNEKQKKAREDFCVKMFKHFEFDGENNSLTFFLII